MFTSASVTLQRMDLQSATSWCH